jgi:hypothetical protein
MWLAFSVGNANLNDQGTVVRSNPHEFSAWHLNVNHFDAGVHKNVIKAGEWVTPEEGFLRPMVVQLGLGVLQTARYHEKGRR